MTFVYVRKQEGKTLIVHLRTTDLKIYPQRRGA